MSKAIVVVEEGPANRAVLEGNYISVAVHVPTYDGEVHFSLIVERDNDGDWRVWVPEVERLDEDGTFVLANGCEGVKGILNLGAPD